MQKVQTPTVDKTFIENILSRIKLEIKTDGSITVKAG